VSRGNLEETQGRFTPAARLDAAGVACIEDAALGLLARVELRGPLTVAVVERLEAHARNLKALAFTGWPPSSVSRDVMDALATTRALPLAMLDLTCTSPDDDVVIRLARGRIWPSLEVLIAPGLGDEAVRALATSRAFPALRGLSLTSGRLTEESARALASPALPWTLERLEVGWNPFSAPMPGSFDPRQMDRRRVRGTPVLRALLARHRVVCLADDRPTSEAELA